MVSNRKLKPLGIYDSVYDLQHTELYSGGELDTVIDASLYAMEHLAFDTEGNRLPFSLQVSLNAQYLNRECAILEDKKRKYMRLEQKVTITIFVWENMSDCLLFEDEGSWGEII